MTNRIRISLLLPTRARPLLVERFFDSLIEHSNHLENIEVVLYVDDDDTNSHNLAREELNISRIIGPTMSMGQYNTACLKVAKGDVIILVNDDIIIRTHGWDIKVLELDSRFSDKIYLAYPNDLIKKHGLSTFPILSRRTCELLVEPYPEQYQKAFIDVHLFDTFKRVEHAGHHRCIYMKDIIFEHMHYRTGKSDCDETYMRRGRFDDDATFVALAKNRSISVQQLVSEIDGNTKGSFASTALSVFEPPSLVSAIIHFSKELLFDQELPIRWRCYLWYWFIGRYLAANVLRSSTR